MKKLGENGLSGISKRMIDIVDNKIASEIICDGDSWVFGCEIADPNIANRYPPDTHPGVYDFIEENDSYRTTKIFPTHLAKLLNVPVTNLSWPADDNGTILRRTINYISQKYLANNIPTDNLFVIIGWSSPERNSFWYKDNEQSMPFRVWPNVPSFHTKAQEKFWEMYVTYLWNPEEYIPRFILDTLQFENFCRRHKIKYLQFNAFYQSPQSNIDQWEELNIGTEVRKLKAHGYMYSDSTTLHRQHELNDYVSLWDTIDSKRFYKKDLSNSTFKSFIDNSSTNPVYCTDGPGAGWHPNALAHKLWATELHRYIKENNLL